VVGASAAVAPAVETGCRDAARGELGQRDRVSTRADAKPVPGVVHDEQIDQGALTAGRAAISDAWREIGRFPQAVMRA